MRGANIVIYPDTAIGDNVAIFDNAVLGRPPLGLPTFERQVNVDIPPLVIGNDSVVGANVVLYAGTKIGNGCLIGDLASIREECSIGNNVIIGRHCSIMYNVAIGNNVRITEQSDITGNTIIEDDVFIAQGVLTANDPHPKCPRSKQCLAGPHFRHGCIIGTGAIVLPSVVVGEYALVGAGSVVTNDVPPGAVVLGCPARVVCDISDIDCPHYADFSPYAHIRDRT